MDIRIGVTYTPKEIALEAADDITAESLKSDVDAALDGGKTLWLTDKKGRQVGIPADKIAYVEIGNEDSNRPIGFG